MIGNENKNLEELEAMLNKKSKEVISIANQGYWKVTKME